MTETTPQHGAAGSCGEASPGGIDPQAPEGSDPGSLEDQGLGHVSRMESDLEGCCCTSEDSATAAQKDAGVEGMEGNRFCVDPGLVELARRLEEAAGRVDAYQARAILMAVSNRFAERLPTRAEGAFWLGTLRGAMARCSTDAVHLLLDNAVDELKIMFNRLEE